MYSVRFIGLMHRLDIGNEAPDFNLPEAYGGSVCLSNVLTDINAVIVFYNGDFGIACNLELKQFKRMHDDFVKAGAEILGISTNSKFVHSAYREHLDLPFPLLSDFDGRVSKAYGVLGGEGEEFSRNIWFMEGRSFRSVFTVDRNRKLQYIWISEDDSQWGEPNYDEVLRVCKSLDRKNVQ